MSVSIFLDSSVLVEYVKNRQTDLLNELILRDYRLFINGTVISEFLYHYLGDVAGKSPRTLKGSQQIPALLQQYDPTPFLRQFHYATDHSCALTEVAAVMQQYNLLPNDAQILAACRQYGFAYLATYDPDFTVSCQQQGIRVIDSLATLNQLITI